ncbi:hypothetical protein evm_000898 [Chilo suppressalis]|nr:hypothetical protein evm_000898 [Chilo suppressalis]
MSSEQEKLVQGDHAENDLTDSSNEESLKEIEQEHTESSTNRIVDDLDNDIEILDDGQDDDEDLHLEWDDDEIEDDIISINVPPLIEKSEEDRYVNKIDDPKGKVSEESINDIVTVDGINEKNTETTQMTEPLSPEESLQNIQSEINKICADIKDNIDQIDSIDEGESKIELNDSDELNKSKSPIEDLILIDDDDDELENIDNKMIDNKKSIDAVEIDDEEYNIGLNQTKTDVTTKDIVKGSKGLTDSKLITTEDNNDEIKVPSSNNQITKTTENVEDKTTDELIEAVKNIEAIIKKNDDLVVDDLIDNTSVIIKSEINEFVTGTIDIQVSETAKEMSKVNTNKLINFPETDSERDNFDLKKTTKCIDDDSDVSIELPDSKSIIIKKEDDIPVSEVTKHIEDTDFEKPVTEFERSNQILDKLTDDKTVGDLNEIIVTSSPNQSIDTSSLEANIDHGLNKPDMMLEIPTQEVIEFLDDTDVSMDFSKSSSNCSSEKRVDENGVLNVDILSDSAIVDPKSDVEKVVLDTAKKETVTEQSEAMEISHTEINQTEISSTINKELIDGGTKPDDKECEKAYSDLTVVANTVTSKRTNEKKGDDTLRTTNDGVHSPVLEEPDSTVPIISESNATTKIATKDKICTVNKEIYKLDNFNKDVSKIKKNSVPSVDETKPLTSQALDEVDNCYKDKSKIEKISVSTFDEPISSTSQTVVTESVDSKDELGSTIDKPIQSTSETIITKAIDSKELVSTIDEPKPSTSQADVTKAIDSKEIKSTIDEPKPSTSQAVIIEAIDSKKLVSTIDEPKPSTSRSKEELGFTIYKSKPSTSQVIVTEASIDSKELVSTIDEPKPSTSQAIITEVVDSKEELDEATDSLGLLAESSRMMEDDEDPDDEEEDDDDFDQDQDESSNQISAEHSEDSNSNAQTSENDQLKEQDEKESPQEDKGEFIFAINDVVTLSQEKEGDIEEKGGDKEVKGGDIEEKGGDIDEKEGDIEEKGGDILEKDDVDVDDVVCEDVVEVTPEQIGTEDNVENNVIVDNIGETETVIDKAPEEKEAMDIETVKLSDTSDNEVEADCSLLRSMLREQAKDEDPLPSTSEKTKKEPSEKTKPTAKRLFITKTSESVINFVDLEESSSEDDVQEVDKTQPDLAPTAEPSTSTDIQGALTAASEPKTPTKVKRTPRINTSEISIRTVSSSEAAAQPQIKPVEEPSTPKFGLEVFNLDSDDEDTKSADETPPTQPSDKQTTDTERAKETVKCINLSCSSAGKCAFLPADAATVAYFDAAKKRRAMVCEQCAYIVVKRTESLVNGIKDFTPLLDLDTTKKCLELVEISDSESEEEAETENEAKEKIGVLGAKMLEQHLADMINKTWKKFKMDVRLTEAQDALNSELKMLEVESKEIDTLLNECQIATDKLRNDLYATFEHDRKELPAFTIYDTPSTKYSTVEPPEEYKPSSTINAKRKLSSASETPAKRPAIPLPYAPIEDANAQDKNISSEISKLDDDKDIAVMQVSAESAPSELPAPGELNRSPLKAGMIVFGMRNILGSWARCRILEVQGQSSVPGSCHTFTIFKVRFDGKARNPVKLLPGRCLAYPDPAEVRLTIGTRVIALFRVTNDSKRETFYSGIVAEVPNPVNKYRYLVFFDDGYAQYVHHSDTRVVCECSSLVWEEVHPFSREFVREYLMAYPERPMVRLHVGQSLKTEWKCKWWSCRVRQVDASLVQVYFEEDNRTEWIYRGSTRLAPLYLELQAAERQRTRAMPRTKAHTINMPYVEYTRSDEQNKSAEQQASPQQQQQQQQQTSERETRQRAVAKKSTTPAPAPPPPAPVPIPDNVTSRVVYYTPKNAVKPYKMVAHVCGPQCKRTDVLALKDLRTYNPLAKPLLSGWERQIVRFKGHKEVMYRAPCGRRLRNMRELHRYLRAIQSDMPCDLFDFDNSTHCLAEFVLNTCLVGKKDLSHGKENVPVPCVNYYDESLPEFCSYNTERTPTAGVPLNLDPEFLCGCDCTDDCEDKSKCACWRMTLEGARTIGLDDTNVGYVYKRLPEPLPSGIYECNSRCKCKHTCLNRVAQHPLQLKLQVFKTLNRGWGIRALNDVPKGSFLCVYAGNLLTDATANMDGLNEGDEYLAELDYIEVVEQMKEGYEEDIPEADKKLDRKNSAKSDESESGELSSSAEEDSARDDQEDDDFQPGIGIGLGVAEFSKRLRKREKKKQKNAEAKQKEKEPASKAEDDCITISDDEEVREPSRFMAQPGMESSEFKSKYSSVRSYFGKDEACYIMDAKVQGNIGRYLNHSCQPNVFVQNVFVDTHDPRFPWVAFFALCHIKAGTELTWNYNYDVGSVPGKILYCYCGAPNCRGRLL